MKITLILVVVSLTQTPILFGQPVVAPVQRDKEPAITRPIEIPDEPKTVDPATLVTPQLAAKVTVKFDGDPLKKVVTWLQQDQKINVIVDYKALSNAKLLDTEPVNEELNDAPLYLLLSRLEQLGLAWYQHDDSLIITSREEYLKHDRTVAYNLGDLFDLGYAPQDLLTAIKRCSGGRWKTVHGGDEFGTAVLLGDVVFIRQTDDIHREIAGLLVAIRKPARRTFTLDTPRHDGLRAALEQKIDVDFHETPLVVAAQELSRLSQISIRLDRVALAKGAVRERTPVTLKLADQKLHAVLRSLLSNMGLSWYLRDDVLWITNSEGAGDFQKTSVYDVRDLSADRDEAIALKEAILSQTRAKWRPNDERGGIIEMPKHDILIVRHTETALDEVLQLLENYRTALKASKLRITPTPDPNQVITGYYRLPQPMGFDVATELQELVMKETWKTKDQPDAVGTIRTITADPSPPDSKGNVVENVVLVINQTRAAHQQIGKLIQTLISSKSIDPEATADTSKQTDRTPGTFGRRLIPKSAE